MILDLLSRRVVGWAFGQRLDTTLGFQSPVDFETNLNQTTPSRPFLPNPVLFSDTGSEQRPLSPALYPFSQNG